MGNFLNRNNKYNQVDLELNPPAKPKEPKKWTTTFATGAKTIRMVLPYFWPKNEPTLRIRVVICVILLVIGKVINLFVPLAYQWSIDALPETTPIMYILLYGLLRWLSNNMKDLRDTVFVNVENYATRTVALDTFKHLHNLSLGFHLSRNTGAVLKTMDRGKNAITTMLSILGFTIAPTLLEVVLTCGVLAGSFGVSYSIITFFTIAGYIAFTLIVTEWRTKYRRAMNETDNEASNKALDSILNYETVKYFTAEQHEYNRYDKSLLAYFDVAVKSSISLAFLNVGQIAIITIGLTLCMLLSSIQVHKGSQTIGELVAINAYIIQLYMPLSWLGTSYRMIINSFTDMEKMFELLGEQPSVRDIPNAPALQPNVEGCEVEFHNVSFTYPRRGESSNNPPVIKNISFKIPRGHTVAVVGQSGSGKTTISRLLCRFYDCDTGMITVDGQDISKVQQLSVRREIGVVPQDTVLFNDTLHYNIEYGSIDKINNNISVEQAAREANIHNFIVSTPDGYKTKVGERGLRLSGGEKQRVAIARTILKDPRILILDEATSALDSKTEKEIQSSLMQVSKGRTVLIVAHRLSTIMHADEILVVKGGQIVERGSHRQLLEMAAEYKAMWDIQAKEALVDQSDSIKS